MDTNPDDTEQNQETLRIMLLGKSGAGKSSSGNTILNRKVFRSDMKLKRVTVHCEKAVGEVGDRSVTMIDTPGFFEKERNKEDIVRAILQRVKLQDPGPHAFVFVVPLGRMTQEDQDTHSLIQAKFGPRVWDYTLVLFTHGDQLEGKTINDIIAESDDNLRNFIRRCSGGFHVFNNKNPEDQTQVTAFMDKIQTLVSLNGGGFYKNELYPEKERRIREKQEEILAQRDEDIRKQEKSLEEHYEEDELRKAKEELWRKEEESSRRAAEKEVNKRSFLATIFRVVLLLMLAPLLISCSEAVQGLWLVPATMVWIVMFLKMFPEVTGRLL